MMNHKNLSRDNGGWNASGAAAVPVSSPESLRQFLSQVYTWMSLGLAITGFAAVATTSSETLMNLIFGSGLFTVLILVELGLVFFFSMALNRGASVPALVAMFLTYSLLNGVTLSVVLLAYTGASVVRTFFVCAGTFGGMSLYGYVTQSDLSGVGHFARMGLWGLIIAGIVNIFLGSHRLEMVMSAIGVGVFVILTAYDTQKLKMIHATYGTEGDAGQRLALRGALQLYLDFINLFLFLLRLMGNRRRR